MKFCYAKGVGYCRTFEINLNRSKRGFSVCRNWIERIEYCRMFQVNLYYCAMIKIFCWNLGRKQSIGISEIVLCKTSPLKIGRCKYPKETHCILKGIFNISYRIQSIYVYLFIHNLSYFLSIQISYFTHRRFCVILKAHRIGRKGKKQRETMRDSETYEHRRTHHWEHTVTQFSIRQLLNRN